MIPEYENDNPGTLDPGLTSVPNDWELIEPDKMENRMYTDQRGIPWEMYGPIAEEEYRVISDASANADTEEQFDEILDNTESESEYNFPFEFGVRGISMALSATGCATITCCRAHTYESHGSSPFPSVLFYAGKQRAQLLKQIATDLPVKLDNYHDTGMVILSTLNVTDMMNFGKAIFEHRADFDKLESNWPPTLDLPNLLELRYRDPESDRSHTVGELQKKMKCKNHAQELLEILQKTDMKFNARIMARNCLFVEWEDDAEIDAEIVEIAKERGFFPFLKKLEIITLGGKEYDTWKDVKSPGDYGMKNYACHEFM